MLAVAVITLTPKNVGATTCSGGGCNCGYSPSAATCPFDTSDEGNASCTKLTINTYYNTSTNPTPVPWSGVTIHSATYSSWSSTTAIYTQASGSNTSGVTCKLLYCGSGTYSYDFAVDKNQITNKFSNDIGYSIKGTLNHQTPISFSGNTSERIASNRSAYDYIANGLTSHLEIIVTFKMPTVSTYVRSAENSAIRYADTESAAPSGTRIDDSSGLSNYTVDLSSGQTGKWVVFIGRVDDTKSTDKVAAAVQYKKFGTTIWRNFGWESSGSPDGTSSSPLYSSGTGLTDYCASGYRTASDNCGALTGTPGANYGFKPVFLTAGTYYWSTKGIYADGAWTHLPYDDIYTLTINPYQTNVGLNLSVSPDNTGTLTATYSSTTHSTATYPWTGFSVPRNTNVSFSAVPEGNKKLIKICSYIDADGNGTREYCDEIANNTSRVLTDDTYYVMAHFETIPPNLFCDPHPEEGEAPVEVEFTVTGSALSTPTYTFYPNSSDCTVGGISRTLNSSWTDIFYHTYEEGDTTYFPSVTHLDIAPECRLCPVNGLPIGNPGDSGGGEVAP